VHLNKIPISEKHITHRLPTNTLSNSKRIHRWGNFIAGFSIEFVEKCIFSISKQNMDGIVLDPFAGCGTTLVAAKNLGMKSVGYEIHPVFYTITSGKLRHYKADASMQVAEILRNAHDPISWSSDAEKYLRKLFPESNLESIRFASGALKHVPPQLSELSIIMFLKICELTCGSQTDGIYKAPTTRKNYLSFEEALVRVESEFTDDICSTWYRKHWLHTPPSIVYKVSAMNMEELEPDSVSACITSPPYLNNFDYAEMTRMHLYLLGWCSSWRDISETVRNHLVTNTTTALNGKKTSEYQREARSTVPASLLSELDSIVYALAKQRQIRSGKKEYDFLIYPYYSQITKVLSSVYRLLRTGAKIHWVVADSALYGVHIETHQHTAEIMRQIGYKNVVIHFLRKRGHRWILSKRDGAKKGLGEYHIEGEK